MLHDILLNVPLLFFILLYFIMKLPISSRQTCLGWGVEDETTDTARLLSRRFPLLPPRLTVRNTGWLFFLTQPSALSNDTGAANTPLCTRSFILLLIVLMPQDSLTPTWGQSSYTLFFLKAFASPARPGASRPPRYVTHGAVSSSLLPPTCSDPSCFFPEQIKQGWVVLKHLCAYPVSSTAPTLGNEQDGHRHVCLKLRLVQTVF